MYSESFNGLRLIGFIQSNYHSLVGECSSSIILIRYVREKHKFFAKTYLPYDIKGIKGILYLILG